MGKIEFEDEQVQKIADLLWEKIEEHNSRYVLQNFCEERSASLKKAVYGLYGIVGLTLVMLIAQMVRTLWNNGGN